jgi:hypothetical protein
MALQPFVGPWPLLHSVIIFTQAIELLGRVISPSQGRYLHTEKTHIQTSMPWMGFEPTIPAFELAKTVNAVDRAATQIGIRGLISRQILKYKIIKQLLQYLFVICLNGTGVSTVNCILIFLWPAAKYITERIPRTVSSTDRATSEAAVSYSLLRFGNW